MTAVAEATDRRDQPARRRLPARRRAPTRAAAAALRRLRTMTTALWLLLAVAAASVVAAFVPQEPTHPITLAHWRAGVEGPGTDVTALLDAAGVTDVFGAWWFLALSAALLASLAACLVVRWRAFVRAARLPPPPGRHLERLAHRHVLDTDLPPAQALAVAARTLRRRAWRVRLREGADTASGRPQVAAQRARWREAGSLVFHTCLPVVLVAALAGQVLGFTGQVDVTEGEAFADTAVAYDSARPGRWWGPGDHRGFTVHLEQFSTSEHPGGAPAEFRAAVTLSPLDGPPRRTDVEINAPLREKGMRVHLARHGLATEIVVRDAAGEALFAEPVRLDDTGSGAWVGLAPVGVGAAGAVLDLVLLPDARLAGDGRVAAIGSGGDAVLLADAYPAAGAVEAGPGEDGPGMREARTGEEGPGTPTTAGAAQAAQRETVRGLDRRAGPLGATAVAAIGRPVALDGTGWTLELVGVERWVGFQVNRTPGSWLLLVCALLGLAGLTVSLFAYPRRLWVEARPRPGGGARLLVAGAARARPWVFARAYPRLVARLDRALAPRP